MFSKILDKAIGWLGRRSYPVYAWKEKRAGFKAGPIRGPIPDFRTLGGAAIDATSLLEKLREDGVVALPDFVPAQKVEELRQACEELLSQMERAGDAEAGSIFDGKFRLESNPAGDGVSRLYHVEQKVPVVQEFSLHPLLQWVGEQYYQRALHLETTLFQRNIVTKEGTRNWHIDSWLNQFKAFLYLDDVTEVNGPFTYLLGSHRNESYLLQKAFRSMRGEESTSVSDEDARSLGLREKHFTATKGTLILADTKGIHQGGTLLEGSRRVLVNYYYLSDGLRVKPRYE